LKEPQWKWEIPVYFFVGGAAGAAAVIAAVAKHVGADRRLARDARWLAAIGGGLSPMLLTADLGVPRRFLNMLRVFKIQSPMSVGAWTLTAFSSASAAAAFAGLLQERFGQSLLLRVVQNAAEISSAATGLLFNNYTGVLIGATAIPVWNKNVSTLPIHFGASGLAAAVSMLEVAGHEDNAPLNALGIGAALLETIEGLLVESKPDPANLPLKKGPSGWITRMGGALSGPVPLLLRLAALFGDPEKARTHRRNAAAAMIAGSLLTRIGWLRAGHASARDYRLPLELPPAEKQTKTQAAISRQ
jgi:hypothetical protein